MSELGFWHFWNPRCSAFNWFELQKGVSMANDVHKDYHRLPRTKTMRCSVSSISDMVKLQLFFTYKCWWVKIAPEWSWMLRPRSFGFQKATNYWTLIHVEIGWNGHSRSCFFSCNWVKTRPFWCPQCWNGLKICCRI